jgi:hypothetical protein
MTSFSDGPESIGKEPEFGEHRGEPLDQGRQPQLRHGGDQLVEHAALRTDFIAITRITPALMVRPAINFAPAGNGSPQHIYGEPFKTVANVDMLHVPYRGSAPAFTGRAGATHVREHNHNDWVYPGRQSATTGSDDGHALGVVPRNTDRERCPASAPVRHMWTSDNRGRRLIRR